MTDSTTQEAPTSGTVRTASPARKPSKGTTVGVHGPVLVALLYRYGSLTNEQICRLTGLHRRVVSEQLKHLSTGGRITEIRDMAVPKKSPHGRPPSTYYLTAPRGVRSGSRELGIENDWTSSRDYKRVNAVVTAAHRVRANEYLLALQAAGTSQGIEAPVEEVWAESNPGFPLFGSAVPKNDREDTSYVHTRIVPDGAFALDVSGALQRYHLEYESKLRPGDVVEKVSKYAGRWRRLIAPSNKGERKYHDPAARLEPLVIITKTSEDAKSLQRSLRERLVKTGALAAEVEAVQRASSGRQIDPCQFVLLAGVEEALADPLGRVYRPLVKHLEEGGAWSVSLEAAGVLAGKVTVPSKKEVKEKAKAADSKSNAKAGTGKKEG